MATDPGIFRSRAVIVEAFQWTDEDQIDDLLDWAPELTFDPDLAGPQDPMTGEDWGRLTIETPSGTLVVSPRDFIVRDATGEVMVRQPHFFASAYAAVA